MKAGTFNQIENWTIRRINNITGEILSEEKFCNAIVNNGLTRMADLLINESSVYFRALGIGTGTTAVTNSDTILETEYTRATAVLSKSSSYVAKFYKLFTFGTGVSENITEAGIFDSATVTASTMLARSVFSAKAISATVDLEVTAEITFARV